MLKVIEENKQTNKKIIVVNKPVKTTKTKVKK